MIKERLPEAVQQCIHAATGTFEKRANHIPPTYKRHFNFCPRKYEDAAETAFAQKSEEGLDLVLGKCATSNRPLVNRIQEMKAQLRQRR